MLPGLPGGEVGRAGLGAQRAGAPRAPRRPPPLLRLERFQSRGAAPLSSAPAQRSSSSSPSSSPCSSFSCRCPQQQLREPAPPLPPSPSSCALSANFPRARAGGAELPAASRPTADRGLRAAVPCISSPRPRRAPETTRRCPGPGTEAQPGRDGWALGFWVRQPRLDPFSFSTLFSPGRRHLEEKCLGPGWALERGVVRNKPCCHQFFAGRPARTAVPPGDRACPPPRD